MEAPPQTGPAAGWYADQTGAPKLRYWDGAGWTDDYRDLPVPTPGPAFAAWWKRAVAILIDIFSVSAAVWPVTATVGAITDSSGDGLSTALYVIALPTYLAFAEHRYGQTFGKRLMKIRVVTDAGEPLSIPQAIARQFARVFSNFVLGLGWWWALWDSQRQTWHDKIVGTYVIDARGSEVLVLPRDSGPDPDPGTAAAAVGPPVTAETVSAPTVARSPSRRRHVAIAAVVVVSLAIGDWVARNFEMLAVVNTSDETEAAMEAWLDERRAFFDIEPPRTEAEAEEIKLAYENVAANSLAELLDADAALADVSILPWHRSIERARSRMQDHTEVWTDQLRLIAADAFQEDGRYDGDISGTFRVAQRAFLDALTPAPLFGLEARVEDIFDE